MCASASVSQVLPRDSATIQVLMSMQMDAYLKKEQIGTLFVRVGALGDGYWGGDGGRGPPSQKIGLTSITFFLEPSAGCPKFTRDCHDSFFDAS